MKKRVEVSRLSPVQGLRFASAALAGLLVDRSDLERGVRSWIVCTCERCSQRVRYVKNSEALEWMALHGMHGTVSFDLVGERDVLISAWGSFG